MADKLLAPDHIRQVLARATLLVDEATLKAATARMAAEISAKLANSNPIVLCTMIGGVIPTGLLLQELDIPLQLDYIHATRYREDMVGKDLEWRVTPKASLEGRTILIVDDILDGGITLAGIIHYCQKHNAKEIYTAVMVEKQTTRAEGGVFEADFTGVKVEDKFVFGYGLDYKGYLRNAPGIYAVAPQDM